MKRVLTGFLCVSSAVCAGAAEEKVATLLNRDPEVRQLVLQPRSLPPTRPFDALSEVTLAQALCKRVTYAFWSNSRHPGYKSVAHLNQDQEGLGVKCRGYESHPTFVSIDTMTNSQFGATFALSFGKEIDIIDWNGVRYYHGASLTALSYEMPAKGRTAYGVIPIWHRGVSMDLSKVPIVLPFKFRGTVGWEELTLPKDKIRVRSWNIGIKKEF